MQCSVKQQRVLSRRAVDVLTPMQRTKLDVGNDRSFYDVPRLVTHVDALFLAKVTQLYREQIPMDGVVLDLCSSWVSHLPKEAQYSRVVGHGMNAEELAKNKQLTEYFVRDLNEDTSPFAFKDNTFDAVVCCVSIQYMQFPEKLVAEISRVLKPGGICIFTFSNRMFPSKAIKAWRDSTEAMRLTLVRSYLASTGTFEGFETLDDIALPSLESKSTDNPLQQVQAWARNTFYSMMSDPFYAVYARKKEGK